MEEAFAGGAAGRGRLVVSISSVRLCSGLVGEMDQVPRAAGSAKWEAL
jgi:hypothetical protein